MFCVSAQVDVNKHCTEVLGKGTVHTQQLNPWFLLLSSSVSYSSFLPSVILRKGVVELENGYGRVRVIRNMECLSSRNGSKSLSNLKRCEKCVGEGEGSLFCFQNKNKRVSSELESQSQRVFLHIVVSL